MWRRCEALKRPSGGWLGVARAAGLGVSESTQHEHPQHTLTASSQVTAGARLSLPFFFTTDVPAANATAGLGAAEVGGAAGAARFASSCVRPKTEADWENCKADWAAMLSAR